MDREGYAFILERPDVDKLKGMPDFEGREEPAVAEDFLRYRAEGWADGEREILPGVTVVPTGGHSAGHQAVVVRGRGPGAARPVAFLGDLAMRPWSANPRWVTAFDDFPLDSVDRKAELFAQASEGGWLIALSHERATPVGRLVPDRDRYRFEPL